MAKMERHQYSAIFFFLVISAIASALCKQAASARLYDEASVHSRKSFRRRAAARSMPCIPSRTNITVNKEEDIYSRVNYSPRLVVTLLLNANIELSQSIVFASNFSCTIFRSATVPRAFTLSVPDTSQPVLKIEYTNNILVHGINFHIPVSDDVMVECSYPEVTNLDYMGHNRCPAVWLYQVYAVQVVQGISFGRIDVYRAYFSRIDSMTITVNPKNFPANIAIGFSGDGPNLLRANVWITNNNLYAGGEVGSGAKVGLMMFLGCVGINVFNNNLFNFVLASLQLGFGQSNVGDAMLNYVAQNYIYHNFGQLGDGTPNDIGGLYMDTHWVGPGNVLRCNYVEGGGHCVYADYVSSGLIIDGLVCIGTADGIKINTGKNNIITGTVLVNTIEPSVGYISCQNYYENNCDLGFGAKWNASLETKFHTPIFRKNFPFLADFCKKEAINGIDCNLGTDAQHGPAITGRCSGLPTENDIELVSVTTTGQAKKAFFQANCDPFKAVPLLNKIRYANTTVAGGRFINPSKGDYGLTRRSPLRRWFPRFRSCPRSAVGPKRKLYASYFNLFNIFAPIRKPLVWPLTSTPAVKRSNISASVATGAASTTSAIPKLSSILRTPEIDRAAQEARQNPTAATDGSKVGAIEGVVISSPIADYKSIGGFKFFPPTKDERQIEEEETNPEFMERVRAQQYEAAKQDGKV